MWRRGTAANGKKIETETAQRPQGFHFVTGFGSPLTRNFSSYPQSNTSVTFTVALARLYQSD